MAIAALFIGAGILIMLISVFIRLGEVLEEYKETTSYANATRKFMGEFNEKYLGPEAPSKDAIFIRVGIGLTEAPYSKTSLVKEVQSRGEADPEVKNLSRDDVRNACTLIGRCYSGLTDAQVVAQTRAMKSWGDEENKIA